MGKGECLQNGKNRNERLKLEKGNKTLKQKEKTGEVHDLIEHSSDKPGSVIVLTEDSDKLHLDRESLEKEADILKWDQLPGSSGLGRWAQALHEEGYHREAKLVEEAPNFVVLKRKAVAAARTRKRSP